jgi:cysteinyl-tRNA synthetase
MTTASASAAVTRTMTTPSSSAQSDIELKRLRLQVLDYVEADEAQQKHELDDKQEQAMNHGSNTPRQDGTLTAGCQEKSMTATTTMTTTTTTTPSSLAQLDTERKQLRLQVDYVEAEENRQEVQQQNHKLDDKDENTTSSQGNDIPHPDGLAPW